MIRHKATIDQDKESGDIIIRQAITYEGVHWEDIHTVVVRKQELNEFVQKLEGFQE